LHAAPDLEEYLRTAAISSIGNFPHGGAHPNKHLIVLEGGLGVVAKPADPSSADAPTMTRCEVAAWIAATELGWNDLVPTTALRTVPLPGGDIESSLQVLLPAFRPAVEMGATPTTCSDTDHCRVAIFDAIGRNTDRNDSNWGFVTGISDVKLVDHGYAWGAWPSRSLSSAFVEQKRGQSLPDELLEQVQAFLDGRSDSRLSQILDSGAVDGVFDRARLIVQSRALQAP
jgi:hypothetical protein